MPTAACPWVLPAGWLSRRGAGGKGIPRRRRGAAARQPPAGSARRGGWGVAEQSHALPLAGMDVQKIL